MAARRVGAPSSGRAVLLRAGRGLGRSRAELEGALLGRRVLACTAPASDWEHDYYGADGERLRRVKSTYDPDNVFCFEQSVPPGGK